MDMNKAIPSPSDGSVTSEVTSFTPLGFAQISSNQELPVPPNQLLLNDGYPVSVLPTLNCLPEKTISMGVNKAMPLPSDAALPLFAQFSSRQELTVPSNQFPRSGRLSLNPILCNASNGLAPKPQYGYPISVLPNLDSFPEKTICMDVSRAMPSPSTPMIVEKKRFVQDRMPREVIDLVDESPSKEDKQEKGKLQPLVYNQAEPNISKTVVSYSSEHLVPSQQMVNRGTVQEEVATWQSTVPKQMALCFSRPTANSSAFLPAVTLETAFSLEPGVKSPCEHVMTSQTISSLNQRASNGDMPEKGVQKCQCPAQNQVELCFLNSVGSASSEPRVPSQVASSEQKQSEVNAIISSEVASSQQKQSELNAILSSELDAEKQSKSENQRIDLNKTPQQKPKRKKHRPKVIREDKPARTPKPKTPKPMTPKQAKKKEENPSGKRKYVRKKKVQNSPDNPMDAFGEIVNPNNANGTKSVRRCLNFDSENLQGRNGCLVSASTLTCNAESEAQKEYVAGSSMSSSTKSTLHHCQGPEVVVGNSPTGITLDLNNSMNQMLNEFVNLAENSAPPLQPGRREMMGTNQMLDGYRRMPKNKIISPWPSKRELIRKNLNDLARKNEYLKVCANHEKSLETGQSRPDLHKISDVMLKGQKRNHNLVGDAHLSASINVTCANNGIDHVSECHDTCSNDPYFSENCKKRRIENDQDGHNGLTSSGASMIYKPLNNSRTTQVVPNNSAVFTFADAQWSMVLEKRQASECLLSFDPAESMPVSATMDCNYRSTPVKQSGYSSPDCTHTTAPVKQSGQSHVDYHRPSTPGKPLGVNGSQQSEICTPQPCMEDIVVNTNTRTKSKNRKKKKQDHPINLQSLKANHMCLQEHEAAPFSPGSSPGQKAPQAAAQALGNSRRRKSLPQTGFSLDCQSSSNLNESLNGRGTVGAIVPYGDPLDDIIQKLKCLNINRWDDGAPTQVQNALVHYDGRGGVMVPYESLLDIARKRRPRAKVDLDPETNRVWKLLMGKEASDEGTDMDKEKWWEEERRVFCGRVDSFIARMHLVQGDRRFSQWKGSVVDSVVGVFLTQNVSDHLSSSAFMALAARFPLKSRDNNRRPGAEKTKTSGEQQDRCMSPSENATKWQESVLHKELYDQDSLVIIGEKEMANSHESYGSNTGGVIADYSKGKCLGAHQRELEIGHESPDRRSDSPATVTGSTSLAEVKDKRSVEDVVSSQNSVVSSQYSSEDKVQTADQNGSSSFSNFEVEELITGSVCNGMDGSTSFTELLRMAELGTHSNKMIPSTDYCGAMDMFAQLDVDKRHTVLNQAEKPKGAFPSMQTSDSYIYNIESDILRVPCDPFVPYNFNNSNSSRLVGMHNANVARDESRCPYFSTPGNMNTNKINFMDMLCGPLANNAIEDIGQQKFTITSETVPSFDSYAQISKQHVQPLTSLETEDYVSKCSTNNNLSERTGASLGKSVSHQCSRLQHEYTEKLQRQETEANFQVENTLHAVKVPCQKQNSQNQQIYPDIQNNQRKALETVEGVESNFFKDESHNSQKVSSEMANNGLKAKKTKVESEKKKTYHWDSLRKEACSKSASIERSLETMDSLDWDAVRSADVKEISETIRERGMNNMLAERIKDFLNRLVRDHGSIDLEWLRDVKPDKAKDYLLSIRGLGLKSVECVRLLTLHHLAFPVDTNVGRICVRLGWVPLQPLPESLQLHLLELYPILETIQKYLWPRLCKLDQRTLYELHYQMITFGKVFCTKSKPNCNACPMRGECKHFASAFASARLALPGPEEKSLMSSAIPIASENGRSPSCNLPLPQLEGATSSQERTAFNNCEPIIEEPATPEAECLETEKSAIEDAFFEDPDEIPTIKLNFEEFTQNLQNYMQVHNMDIQDGDMSKALVAIAPEAASIPMPKLKNVSRLRTEHQVYELPDSHPLLEGLDRREPDDPCSYLLAIWTPGETAQSTEPPEAFCNSQETGKLCDRKICFACNSIREAQAQTVRGTLLIPCRTAMRGSFPLNGTYFQVNEVFADHDSSRNPIDVPREWIWNLPRRTVYFGTTIPTIFKGLTTEGIQQCFWKGFVCVRGFDRTTRAPKPLYARLHFPASKAPKNKKAAAAAARAK